MLDIDKIGFSPLKTNTHKTKLLSWFTEKHVLDFYYGEGLQNTLRNINLSCDGISNNGIYNFYHWIGYYEDTPFSFLMTTPIIGPFDADDDYNKWFIPNKKIYTLDLLIGEKKFLGKGIAAKMISKVLLNEFCDADYFLIDPEKIMLKQFTYMKKLGLKYSKNFVPSLIQNLIL